MVYVLCFHLVPPLMFGSLVDSKPFSDEESSMITQSMNTDVQRVPLNGKIEYVCVNCWAHVVSSDKFTFQPNDIMNMFWSVENLLICMQSFKSQLQCILSLRNERLKNERNKSP